MKDISPRLKPTYGRTKTLLLSGEKHAGFNVFSGDRVSPKDDTAMENLARYSIRASLMSPTEEKAEGRRR
ncbi:MAG: hypothetical protein C0394_01730 [Syntrophus sp. (in: bacteria)]|nr:hypothetical protein [Syntrophus sp. (in: bacteria)]